MYPRFPSEEEWQVIISNSGEVRDLIFFACSSKEQREFLDSVKHFNDKLGKLRLSYYFVQYYFDDPQSADLFEYYVEDFYIRLFSLWDFIYHLINEYYRFWINTNEGMGFKNDVKRQLHKTDRDLSEYLRKMEQENRDFRTARQYRNTIVHQVFPGDDSIELVRSEWTGKIHPEVKNAVAPHAFISNISVMVTLLSETIEMLQKEFIDPNCDKV